MAWRTLLTNPNSMYAPSDRGGAFAITDQLALNMILEQQISPIVSTADDWRVIHAMNNTLKLMPLPALLFTNGHVFFYQHLPELHHVQVTPSTLVCVSSCVAYGQGWPSPIIDTDTDGGVPGNGRKPGDTDTRMTETSPTTSRRGNTNMTYLRAPGPRGGETPRGSGSGRGP
jgi:hypothetical protein